jgi:uncharacterized protein YuzE
MAIELSDIQPLLSCFIKHKITWTNYDDGADTLYIHFKRTNNADNSQMVDNDIVVRYANNEVIGLTYLHASKRK